MTSRIERMEKLDLILDMTVREFLDALWELKRLQEEE